MRHTGLMFAAGLLVLLGVASGGRAWNAHGHRMITQLALEGLPADLPDWLREPQTVARVMYQSSEPDRWRGSRMTALHHINKPDHYLDVELLEQFGLTLETVPPLRHEYLRAMVIAKHEHPEQIDPYDAERDRDRTTEWPGLGLHAVVENYAKLQSSFKTVRILEAMAEDTPRYRASLAQARENAIYSMGVLSHFVGDLAQPLHTTKHHNGWVGDNPNGYTTADTFHADIDGRVIAALGITVDQVRPAAKYDRVVQAADPWDDVAAYVRESFGHVEPLYRMERDGQLRGEEGRALLVGRLATGANMLNALYVAAWRSATPGPDEIGRFRMYDDWDAAAATSAPASVPTGGPTSAPASGPARESSGGTAGG